MRHAGLHALAGTLLIGVAGALSHRSAADEARQPGEPLALLLAPLGPAKALLSSALWVQVWHESHDGDPERLVPLACALLELHPGLDHVREFLAGQLIVTEAPRATDAARHDALVHAGLDLLEEGRLRSDSPSLHAALGRLLYLQRLQDPGFQSAVEGYFGGSLVDVAIDALARSDEPEIDARLCAELLVERGLLALEGGERGHAQADLEQAEAVLSAALATATPAADEAADSEALLAPLREALAQGASGER